MPVTSVDDRANFIKRAFSDCPGASRSLKERREISFQSLLNSLPKFPVMYWLKYKETTVCSYYNDSVDTLGLLHNLSSLYIKECVTSTKNMHTCMRFM